MTPTDDKIDAEVEFHGVRFGFGIPTMKIDRNIQRIRNLY